MADPTPCEPGYKALLAKEYLRTISGNTTEDPIGYICTPGDVDEWRVSIIRIRTAFGDAMKRVDTENLAMPSALSERVANWVFKSLRIPTGSAKHLSGRICHDDVANAVDFGKRGVQLLFEIHCAMHKAGGLVPTPPSTSPPRKELPYGTGFWTLVLVVTALGIVAYLKPKG